MSVASDMDHCLEIHQAEAPLSASMISGIARDTTFEGTMITDPGSAGFKIQ
jgi:hypothetical protein